MSVFFGPKMQNFQRREINKKNEKTFPRHVYLHGFGKFLVIFVQKYSFYPCQKYFGSKNHFFGNFSKIQILAKNLTIQINSL